VASDAAAGLFFSAGPHRIDRPSRAPSPAMLLFPSSCSATWNGPRLQQTSAICWKREEGPVPKRFPRPGAAKPPKIGGSRGLSAAISKGADRPVNGNCVVLKTPENDESGSGTSSRASVVDMVEECDRRPYPV
jgi:hypothetical protein